jgi:hypothetical protein
MSAVTPLTIIKGDATSPQAKGRKVNRARLQRPGWLGEGVRAGDLPPLAGAGA